MLEGDKGEMGKDSVWRRREDHCQHRKRDEGRIERWRVLSASVHLLTLGQLCSKVPVS